jgi:predicted MFS family arabinose efflux permease
MAGIAALVMVTGDLSWRACWAFFAVVSACALIGNWTALRAIDKNPCRRPRKQWRYLAITAALPLYAIGFAYGTNSAIYISFAADHMVEVGGVPGAPVGATPALVYICYGLFGLVGLLTGRIKDMIGLPMLLRLLMLCGTMSLALLVIAPGTWAGLVSSAGLQGIHVMMTSAVLALWSERLFPSLPSLSFTAALLAAAGGSVLGPAIAGLASDALGARSMFLGTAALPGAMALLLSDRHVQDRSARTTAQTSL